MTSSEAIQFYAQLIFQDEAAHDAAIEAAWDAGEQHPKSFGMRALSGLARSQGQNFEDTLASQQQVLDSLPKHARIGATAYVLGGSGNCYTDYLNDVFGPYTEE